ncbi:hypothetical protein PIB30_014035 [Stylosanthes scabra]|uniref:Glucose-6-phosphate dehydrogenase NAD-binding domain-containing protein n=1 Tax=Stylosanthes scabra TaxID=79078 RepID=A0ABU6Z475_9FABA|nr:hypothetical protein [Stylosanthes scabra]
MNDEIDLHPHSNSATTALHFFNDSSSTARGWEQTNGTLKKELALKLSPSWQESLQIYLNSSLSSIVAVGASGDLAKKKVFPALFQLHFTRFVVNFHFQYA